MRKILLVSMLAITGITGDLFAQNDWIFYAGRTNTDQLFNVSKLPSLRHRFVIRLQNSNNVTIRVTNKEEFQKLLNLDSIIKTIAKNLVLFKDSLQDETIQKRIDYVNDAGGFVKIRIKQYPPNGTSFVLQPDGPALLKIEQDSLNIIGYQSKPRLGGPQGTYVNVPYHISFLINDVNKLESLADGTLNKVMQELEEQWDGMDNWSAKKNNSSNLYAYYNTSESKFSTPLKNMKGIKKWIFRPYFQLGLQNVNNILTGSAGVGFEIVNRVTTSFIRRYQLMWEPYFFFDKTPEKTFSMQRNDFVTLQLISESATFLSGGGKVEYSGFVSIGYLVYRSGNYFSDHTIKAGLPGMSFKFLSLHPEFIFHDFFKNFQPALKLTLDLD